MADPPTGYRFSAEEILRAIGADRLPNAQRTALQKQVKDALAAGDDGVELIATLGPQVSGTNASNLFEAEATKAQQRNATKAGAMRIPDANGKPVAPPVVPPKTPTPSAPPTTPQPYAPSVVAQTILQGLLQNPPRPDDPRYGGDVGFYQADYTWWQDQVTKATALVKSAQELDQGIVSLPDGTMIDTHDPAIARDPVLASQVAAIFANQDAKTMNDYYATLNDLGLKEYAGQTAATNANNDTLSKDFQNALSKLNAQVAVGQANQKTATDQINRQLSGLQESRARADQVEKTLETTSPWATTPGKTAFSPSDFGAAGTAAARYAGLPAAPGQPVLQFTGTRTVDPAALLAQGDAALGVGGPLPQVPGVGVDQAQVPHAPQLAMVGGPPALQRPVAPTIPQRGPSVVPPPPNQPTLAMQSVWDVQ